MNEEDMVHTHTHTHTQWTVTQPQEKNENFKFATTWVDLESIMLSEINQRKTLLYVESKNRTNECV